MVGMVQFLFDPSVSGAGQEVVAEPDRGGSREGQAGVLGRRPSAASFSRDRYGLEIVEIAHGERSLAGPSPEKFNVTSVKRLFSDCLLSGLLGAFLVFYLAGVVLFSRWVWHSLAGP